MENLKRFRCYIKDYDGSKSNRTEVRYVEKREEIENEYWKIED